MVVLFFILAYPLLFGSLKDSVKENPWLLSSDGSLLSNKNFYCANGEVDVGGGGPGSGGGGGGDGIS